MAVSVYDARELTRTVRVELDGTVHLPLLKNGVMAAGVFPGELEASIADALKAEQILVDPIVKVTVVEYHSRPIAVMGAVRRPVTFQAAGTVTLLDALARAEGLTNEAGAEILLTRSRGVIERISVKRLMKDADPAVNFELHGGEEIRVPEAGKIFVVGNVRRPGAFPVRDAGVVGARTRGPGKRRHARRRRAIRFSSGDETAGPTLDAAQRARVAVPPGHRAPAAVAALSSPEPPVRRPRKCTNSSRSPNLSTAARPQLAVPTFMHLMDKCVALPLFVASLPVMAAAAVWIKLASRGPVFYCQTREGFDGCRIPVWKLRTMYLDRPAAGEMAGCPSRRSGALAASF